MSISIFMCCLLFIDLIGNKQDSGNNVHFFFVPYFSRITQTTSNYLKVDSATIMIYNHKHKQHVNMHCIILQITCTQRISDFVLHVCKELY